MSPHFKNKQDYTYLSFVEVRGKNLSLKLEVSVFTGVEGVSTLFPFLLCALEGSWETPLVSKIDEGG